MGVPQGGPSEGARRTPLAALGRRWFPPARVVWLSLVGIGLYGVVSLQGLGLPALLVLPLLAVGLDLGLQRARFDRPRVPDAALATGLFVALLLPPTAPLLLSGGCVVVAIGIRHVLRSRGHPWFNPAALGVLVGAVAFGTAPAWWVAVGPLGPYLGVAVGLSLVALRVSRWRLPAVFLGTYGLFAAVQHVALGASVAPAVLMLQTLDPTTLFFAFFMVAEPRTSPTDPASQTLYAGTVGILAAFAPIALPTVGVLAALLGGNLLAVALRRRHEVLRPAAAPRAARRRRGGAAPTLARWTLGRRAAAGLAVVLVVAVVASIAPGAAIVALPPGGSAGSTTPTGCAKDNPAIPASTLAELHKLLGPSVIRSYDASTGVVVFFDPVHDVTVTETDLYEDFGYAEFNGDDYAVSGCSAA